MPFALNTHTLVRRPFLLSSLKDALHDKHLCAHFQIQQSLSSPCVFDSLSPFHAPMNVLDLDFVPAHQRHRVHELLQFQCCLLQLFFSCRLVCSCKHFCYSFPSLLGNLRVVAFVLVLVLLSTSSRSLALPRSRGSSITKQLFPLFASLRLRSPLLTRPTLLKLPFAYCLLDRFHMQRCPSPTVS